MNYLLEFPRIVSQNIREKLKEQIFMFNLYMEIGLKDYFKIFKAFPYILCVDNSKLQKFLGEFKKYKFTK